MKKELILPLLLLLIRLYVGWQWLQAGIEKITNQAWVGSKAGTAVGGFLMGALSKTSGEHPNVQWWYAEFIKNFALPNKVLFSYLVSYGELLVGVALIIGALTPVAAFFGAFMNFNYLFAGTVSTNPVLLLGEIVLMFFWKKSGQIGLDRYLMPKISALRNKRK